MQSREPLKKRVPLAAWLLSPSLLPNAGVKGRAFFPKDGVGVVRRKTKPPVPKEIAFKDEPGDVGRHSTAIGYCEPDPQKCPRWVVNHSEDREGHPDRLTVGIHDRLSILSNTQHIVGRRGTLTDPWSVALTFQATILPAAPCFPLTPSCP